MATSPTCPVIAQRANVDHVRPRNVLVRRYKPASDAGAVMSLVQSAGMNGHGPYAYPKDVLTPMHRVSRIEEWLPNRWQATGG